MGAKRWCVLALVALLAFAGPAVREYTREVNVEHGEGQEAVFWLVLGAFISPLLSPFLHLKLFFLNDVLPSHVEAALVRSVGKWLFTPIATFKESLVPEAPDYAQEKFWSMKPGRNDTSEKVAEGCRTCEEVDACGLADVFYLHPTTWYTSASWNAPVLHPITAFLSDEAIGPQQANAFNILGRVFAPRYRQMSAGGFMQQELLEHPNSKAAIEVAYQDVKAAFEYYLAHHWDGKRGIVLAGHSQGSILCEKLLLEFFQHKPLHEYLVAAYLPGWTLSKKRYDVNDQKHQVTVCEHPESTGCVLSWRTFSRGGDPELFLHVPSEGDDEPICTNPLSWKADTNYIGHEHNLGGLDLLHPWTMLNYLWKIPSANLRVALPSLTPRISDAACEKGHLFVTDPPRTGAGWYFWPVWQLAVFPGKNLHSYDYNLFYNNIRENALLRAKVFQAQRENLSMEPSD